MPESRLQWILLSMSFGEIEHLFVALKSAAVMWPNKCLRMEEFYDSNVSSAMFTILYYQHVWTHLYDETLLLYLFL